MNLTPEQEREYFAELEKIGPDGIRRDLADHKIPANLVHYASLWVSRKEQEREARDETFKSEQIEIARSAAAEASRASVAAERAATAAERAATATERQADAAEIANTRAKRALVIAIISIIISAAGILWSHWDGGGGQKDQAKVQTKTH